VSKVEQSRDTSDNQESTTCFCGEWMDGYGKRMMMKLEVVVLPFASAVGTLVLVWSGIVSSFYSLLEFGRSVGSSTTAGENTRLSAYGMYVFMYIHTMYVHP
jgi:hypothetical protein